jgi:mannose-6-phosphate isomerase-like protein (cupin superfamily)
VQFSEKVRIERIPGHSDRRGLSFALSDRIGAALGAILDTHIATILTGEVRGNHYHLARREVIIVIAEGPWCFAWDPRDGSAPRTETFVEAGAVSVEIEAGTGHAIRNQGDQPLTLFSLSNGRYSKESPDTYPQALLA